ncbi:hypothetical protein C8Q79DRAFT_287984 [Trametes meyenii]|nr:hypothetical protein C8Q79DRAFT_287984 [Trametes meyenii]
MGLKDEAQIERVKAPCKQPASCTRARWHHHPRRSFALLLIDGLAQTRTTNSMRSRTVALFAKEIAAELNLYAKPKSRDMTAGVSPGKRSIDTPSPPRASARCRSHTLSLAFGWSPAVFGDGDIICCAVRCSLGQHRAHLSNRTPNVLCGLRASATGERVLDPVLVLSVLIGPWGSDWPIALALLRGRPRKFYLLPRASRQRHTPAGKFAFRGRRFPRRVILAMRSTCRGASSSKRRTGRHKASYL